ncbi:response regulator [bacterium]|nr:response regulator [bacterium]MBU1936793.1 response regulator [bacterium]
MGIRLKVLVVDDEAIARNLLHRVNDYFGFETIEAEDGQEGWKLFQEIEPDIVISDIYMPNMNGIQLLSCIKRSNSDSKVILITGFPNYRSMVKTSPYPPDGFLEKPFKIEDLGRLMRTLTGKQLG